MKRLDQNHEGKGGSGEIVSAIVKKEEKRNRQSDVMCLLVYVTKKHFDQLAFFIFIIYHLGSHHISLCKPEHPS